MFLVGLYLLILVFVNKYIRTSTLNYYYLIFYYLKFAKMLSLLAYLRFIKRSKCLF